MKRSIILLLLLPFAFSCANNIDAEIDLLFKDYDGDVPGAAVFIIRDGVPVFGKSYGYADLEAKKPVAFRTNFRLASVTKQFTAMAVLMLVEQDRLTFNTTLKDIFPDFPPYGKDITIRHLLQHTSGLVDYESLLSDEDTTQVLDCDVLDLMMGQDSTYFAPGTQYQYSNSGYALLAKIIEEISGLPFAEYIKKNIFDPLKMENSIAWEKGVFELPFRAYGYAFEDSVFTFSDQSRTSAVLGDGGIYSSILDLYRWDQALYTDRFVSYETLNRAFTPGELANGQKFAYGFGWRLEAYNGYRCVYHTGSTCGFRNIIKRYPDMRFTVIVLTNRNEPGVKVLADKLTDLYLKNDAD